MTATPGDPEEMAIRLRDQILAETGLHASFGIATCKTVAKIASDLRKPRGFVVVRPGDEAEFLRPLPLRTLPGLGPSTAGTLAGLGLRTLGELAGHPAALLERRLGKAAAHSLTRRARGIDTSPVVPPSTTKSISREETYDRDVVDAGMLRERVRHLSADVGRRLRAAGLSARTVSLKIRYADFTSLTRQCPLDGGSDSDAAITSGALALLLSLIHICRPRDPGADRLRPRRGRGTTPGGGDLDRPTLGGDRVPVSERQATPGGAARRVRRPGRGHARGDGPTPHRGSPLQDVL